MIEIESVLIVGAGASCPYGFPSGERLRTEIIRLLEMASVDATNKSDVAKFIERNSEPHLLRSFLHDFKLSPRNSIDIFIEGRPEFSEIGKLAIASILCAYEREGELCGNNKIRDEDWLNPLFNDYLVPTGRRDDFAKNKLKVITFNYDRSIEHRFTNDIHRTFGGTIEDARQLASQVEVIHVHGQLGNYFDSEDAPTIAFDSKTDERKLLQASESISYFFEPGDKVRLEKIRATIASAIRIGFIGFSYDSVNLNRLIFPKDEEPLSKSDPWMAEQRRNRINHERRWKADKISGTTFGLPAGRKARAKSYIGEISSSEILFEDCKCRQFIENSTIFI